MDATLLAPHPTLRAKPNIQVKLLPTDSINKFPRDERYLHREETAMSYRQYTTNSKFSRLSDRHREIRTLHKMVRTFAT
jgi:hypothetical protein